jgi:hypothetical protein
MVRVSAELGLDDDDFQAHLCELIVIEVVSVLFSLSFVKEIFC